MVGVARVVGSAVGQVGIQLALEKVAFNKDVQQTTKQTENAFSKTFGKIGKTVKSAFNGMKNTVTNALNNVRSRFSEAFHKISTIIKGALLVGSAFMIKFSKDAIQAASDTQAAWTGLNSIVTGTGKSFKDAKNFINEYVSDGLVPLTDAVTAYKTLAARGYETEQIEGIMNALKDSSSFNRQSALSQGEAIRSAAEGLKNENSVLVDNAGVTKNVAKMWEEYAASIGTTANNLTLAQKRQAEYNGILAETKFQTGDAAIYANTYAGKIAKLNTAFYNLKVTVGQVLTPIIELFLPAITKAINALTTMFNKLKSIMAVFGLEMKEYYSKGGSSVSSAIDSATDSSSGLSSGLDSAGTTAQKTAKKIKKAFAGIDEINVLNMPDTSSGSSGSSGSGGDDSSIGGSTGDIDTSEVSETEEEMKQKLEWLSRSAYDWGVAFGEALNKGMKAIPWDGIQSTVVKTVEKIAQFLNGATEGLDWHLLGATLSEGYNTALYGLNTFFKEYDWDVLGKSLGTGINGIIDTVDWKTTGEFLGRKFSVPFQILSNMFEEMDWSKLGVSLGNSLNKFVDYVDFNAIADTFTNGFNGIFTTINSFFTTTDWSGIAKDLIGGLNRAISNVDFKIVGETIKNGLNGAIDFVWTAIKTFDAEKAGQKVAELINSLSDTIKNTDWDKVGKSISDGLRKAIEFLKEAITNTDWNELAENIVKGIWDIISNIDWGQLILDILDFIWECIKANYSHFYEKGQGAGKKTIEGLWAGIEGMKDWIIEKWNGVKDWFTDIVKNARIEITQKWEDIKKKWNDLTQNIKDKTADMKARIATKWSNLSSSWSNITKNIKDKTADMKARIATKWSNLSSSWSGITRNIKDKTADMKARVASKWSDLKYTWNSLMSNFKDKTVSIKIKIGEIIGSFKSMINENMIKPLNKKLPSFIPKIPYLAQGGWLKANNPQLAVVGDNKSEPEIVSPESKIKEQVIKGIQEVGGANTNQKIDFTIKLEYPDGRYLIKEINNTQIKDGKISLLI